MKHNRDCPSSRVAPPTISTAALRDISNREWHLNGIKIAHIVTATLMHCDFPSLKLIKRANLRLTCLSGTRAMLIDPGFHSPLPDFGSPLPVFDVPFHSLCKCVCVRVLRLVVPVFVLREEALSECHCGRGFGRFRVRGRSVGRCCETCRSRRYRMRWEGRSEVSVIVHSGDVREGWCQQKSV